MEDTIYLTPTIVRRVRPCEDGRDVALGVLNVPHRETGEPMILVFMNPEQAEAWRVEDGRYPTSEGFKVVAVDVEGLKAISEVWGFAHVALWGPEPDTVSDFSVDRFLEMLEGVEPIETV